MGGGKKGGGGKVPVTKYLMSQHFGICAGPVDAIQIIWIKEKIAWQGAVAIQQSFIVDNEELFGGIEKEGGVEGVCYYLPGYATQVVDDLLAVKLGRSSGADCPGYRGIASIFMVGPNGTPFAGAGGWTDHVRGQNGFYWSGNIPYLPVVWVTVKRAPVGLTPGYALIPRLDTNYFPFETNEDAYGIGGGHFSPDFTQLIIATGSTGFQIIDVASRQVIYADTTDQGGGPVGWNDDGSFLILADFPTQELYRIPAGGGSRILVADNFDSWASGVFNVGDLTCLLTYYLLSAEALYLVGDHVIAISPGFTASHYFESEEGEPWACGAPDAGTGACFMIMPDGDLHTVATGSSALCYAMDNFGGQFLLYQGGDLFLIDKVTFTITAGPVDASNTTDPALIFRNVSPGANTIWLTSNEFNTADLSLHRTVVMTDWTAEGVVNSVYDPLNHALITSDVFGDNALWRFLDRGGVDANPAHMSYESLTNTDWGMGSPLAALDTASFEAAGVTLYNEGLGLSMIWTRQSSIQDFIQEVLDHAQAVLFVDPTTGLLTFKLIRGDYDPNTLDVINQTNANLSDFTRKLWGEIPNEMVVTWTSPETEQDETVAIQDLGSIATQGSIVSDSRNYYGVRSASLAMRLAQRDLRGAGQPLASCEAEVDRTLWQVRPASVYKVTWPEYGLANNVMRVVGVNYGKPGDPTIRMSLLEDVFGLDVGVYQEPPGTSWEEPTAPPVPIDAAGGDAEVLTLPAFVAGQYAAGFAVTPTYPNVLSGVLATSDADDAMGYELWAEKTLSDGSLVWSKLNNMSLVGRGTTGATELPAEAQSVGITLANFSGDSVPVRAGFVIIGDDGEDGNEIAMFTAVNNGTFTYTLSRGVLDTVPRAWAAATPVWFVDSSLMIVDPVVRSSGETVEYKLLTRTSVGLLSLYAAPLVTYTLTDRPWQPNRPAGVTAYGVTFSSADSVIDALARPDPWVTVAWANRNRLLEDTQVLAWTDPTVAPETGQTTTITVLATDGTTVLATHSGLTGTTFDVPDASFSTEDTVIIRTSSSRTDADGTFESLQFFDHWVKVGISGGAGAAVGMGAFSGVSSAIAGSSLAGSGTGALAAEGSTAGWAGPPDVVAVGALADNGSTTADVLVPYPAAFSLQADDIAFIEFGSESAVGTAHTIETPSGWTQADQQQLVTIGFFRHAVFWKRLDGTESGTVSIGVDIAHPSTHSLCGVMSIVRGAIASGTPYEDLTPNTANDANMVGAAIDTTDVDRLVLHFGMADGTATTATPGGSFAEEYDLSTTSGNEDHGLHLMSLEQPTAATVGPTTHTLSVSTRWQTFALAVLPL